jgi:hypothetical protein
MTIPTNVSSTEHDLHEETGYKQKTSANICGHNKFTLKQSQPAHSTAQAGWHAAGTKICGGRASMASCEVARARKEGQYDKQSTRTACFESQVARLEFFLETGIHEARNLEHLWFWEAFWPWSLDGLAT